MRSTWWALAAAGALAVGTTALASLDQPMGAPPEVSEYALLGFPMAQLALLVVAIPAITSEYGTGAIASSLLWVPRRPRLLAAKAVSSWPSRPPSPRCWSCRRQLRPPPSSATAPSSTWPPSPVRLPWPAPSWRSRRCSAWASGRPLRSTAGTLTVVTLLLFVLPNLLGSLANAVAQQVAEVLPGTAAVVLLAGITQPYPAGPAWTVMAHGGWARSSSGCPPPAAARRLKRGHAREDVPVGLGAAQVMPASTAASAI